MERLRWVLVAGSAVLIALLIAFVGYGRYRALKTWRTLLKRSGVTISHDTNGFTYSQSLQGRTVFTLHAVKARQQPDGEWALDDADLTLYSKATNRTDQIYGAKFAYDPHTGVVRALGEVHMDLEAPMGLTHAGPVAPQRIRGREGRAPSALRPAREDLQTIHVRTSGLMYTRSTEVATTADEVEFEYGNAVVHAHGAEFDQKASTVHLLADVQLESQLHEQPLTMTATKADLDRDKNLATLESPVAKLQGRTLSAEHAVLTLRKDGSVQTVDASGGVTLLQGTATLRGARLTMSLSERTVPESGTLSGGVALVDTNAQRPLRGAAQQMAVRFDAKGQPELATATGAAQLVLQTPAAEAHTMLMRSVSGDTVQVALAADDDGRARVRTVHAMGHARASGDSVADGPGVKPAVERRTTTVTADDLLAQLGVDGDGRAVPETMDGTGHTMLEQTSSSGARQTSTGQTLAMAFAPSEKNGATAKAGAAGGPGWQVENAVQSGDVHVMAQAAAAGGQPGAVTTARAARAVYRGEAQELTLSGAASFTQNGVESTADTIVVEQASGDAAADGHVVATLFGNAASGMAGHAPAAAQQPAVSHVMSDHARFFHASERAIFTGTDGHPARLWHEASQVQAAVLTMDGQTKTLMARPTADGGRVSAIFAGGPDAEARRGQAVGAARIVAVQSPKMDYNDTRREAVFSGGVAMREAGMRVDAERAVVFLAPASGASAGASNGTMQADNKRGGSGSLLHADPVAGSIDHAVALGDVRLSEAQRSGEGDELVYTAGTDSYILSGTAAKPAHVADVQQGNVTGATLVFGQGDSTIVVAGENRKRVRTEAPLTDKQAGKAGAGKR